MLVQSTTVVNSSDSPKWLKDRQLPGGRVKLEPGATLLVTQGVWLRNRRACRAWLQKVDDGRVLAHSLKNEKPVVADTAESVFPEEPVTETTELEITSEDEEQGETPEPEMKMSELRAIARELDIKAPVGTTKAELIEMIESVETKEVSTDED
jgi:hypothetical protein